LAPLRETPTGGLLFPAGEEIFSVDLELKAIVEPDLTFRATMTSQTTGRRGGLGGLFCLRALQRDGGFRAALLLSGGINDGVAESHRCVAPLEARPLRPAQPPMRGAFFASGLGPPFLSRSGGIKARLAESTRRVPHQRDPQTRRRNDAMAWSTPEVREVCVGMEVTSYLSAEM
jgi:coenzyme PQQ precursor peptide PqqA